MTKPSAFTKITVIADATDDYIPIIVDQTGSPLERIITHANFLKDVTPIGIHDFWVGATGMWPSTTNGCAALAKREIVSGVDIQTLNFDGATDETAQFTISLPRNFDNATITFHVYWTSATGTALTTIWDLSVLARSDNDPLNASYTDLTSVTDTWIANDDVHISPESADMTVTSHVDGDLIQFKINRDATADTATVDAELIGIMLHITTDSAVAA